MARHNELGKWGEQYAADYLQSIGYDIIERDWRIGHRDIDIIARTGDGTTVVFVEVKTRTSDVVTKPDDAVDIKKIRNIGYAANNYIKTKGIVDEVRFDIISIIGNNKENAQLEHIIEAFNPCLAY
ncbi:MULTISPECIES: YraN family protein [Prevotellaceae]|jgi:putative endonuclease|uniref:YraN family protein n=1 Tax=Leyella stercorea TaxID=363265 RepID=UPI001F37388E|nr:MULTISPECIES: YraN family protein [Prevotellaceae]MCF2646087.1 YraN family protein [Leyella stercorea]MCI6130307.1 YraN family protein [Prevotella sp.]MCI7372041.1 YraN family protein [Prevotella sp.]MDY3967842.1 YraN family protein [Prevotella sp.]